MTTRYFTSAALRPHEEVAAELVAWLQRSIAVAYEGDRPVSGVWTTVEGWQRVCWYASAVTPALVEAHAARYGAVPFWVIDRSAMRERVVEVYECDATGRVWASRTLTFDKQHLPEREAHRAEGAPAVVRRFTCWPNGGLSNVTEQVAGRRVAPLAPPYRFPALELVGEFFPRGATIGRDGPRIVEPIVHTPHGGRAVVVYLDGATWRRGLAAWSRCGIWRNTLEPVLGFEDPMVARLVYRGELTDPRFGAASVGLVEALPEGRTLADVVLRDGVLGAEVALALALEVAAVVRRAHAAGHPLGGVHAELIFSRAAGAQRTVSAIAHRAPAVIAHYLESEPGMLSLDAAKLLRVDDATALAQLVWFLITGTQPFVVPATEPWPTWYGARHPQRRRQAWIGGAALGALLERALFADKPMAFDALVDGLAARRGEVEPYR